ncbi:type IIL restriction-modification enzyme MmeI, partial [Vibrio parahaemolyticus]|uniref:type IIL restriction-modification enzyme MmeI n=1 Tax=Vibrio parahaemolyticus TaxID=670 RepID=UPI00358F949D
MRENGNTVEKNFIDYPYRFVMNKEAKDFSLLIPVVSSERRKYLPVGLLGSEYIVLNSANAIYDGDAYVFGILSSLMHMT